MANRRSCSIADDDRARIPFALVGVLLLVSSVAYAGALEGQGRLVLDDDVERAMERADADLTPTIRTAATTAASEAGAAPVTSPPDGPAAVAVREGSAFEDALRIRIALSVDEALTATERQVGDVHVQSDVPPVEGPADLLAARQRVTIDPVENGTAMRVTVGNVTTTATRDGRVVAEETRNVSVVVAVPILAAHERVERYERQLNRGPLEGPGLGRQLTARLYPVTWARGYAQYRGAPVQNVLSNRHVELSTNAGIASVQRDTFGGADPVAEAGVRRAADRTGVADLLEPTSFAEEDWSRIVVGDPASDDRYDGDDNGLPSDPEAREGETTTVSADAAADAALVETVDSMASLTRSVYRVEATLRTEKRLVSSETETSADTMPAAEPPGDDWWLVHESSDRDVTVDDRRRSTLDGFGSTDRTVIVVDTTTWEWSNGSAVETTSETVTERYRVEVSVAGEYAPSGGAPERGTRPIFERGGPLDGPNLEGVPPEARHSLGAEGTVGIDAIAHETVRSGNVHRSTVVSGDRPTELVSYVEDDLARLHGEVRGLTTEVRMEAVAAGEADPHGELADELRDRRESLVDAPDTYDGAADRARVATRAAYLDAVIQELEEASTSDAEAADALVAETDLPALGADSPGAILEARDAAADPDPYVVGSDGPGGGVELVPRGTPGYLPRTAVEGETVAGMPPGSRERPLATRNLNYVTLPYGDVASGILDRVLGTGQTVSVRDGGRALIAADRALETVDDADLRNDRDELATDLERAMREVDRTADAELRGSTTLTGAERRDVRNAAAAEWRTTGELAVAMGNGSYATAVAREASHRADLDDGERALLEARLRTAVRASASRRVDVSARLTNRTLTRTHDVARDRIEADVQEGIEYGVDGAAERWAPRTLQAAPTGVPLVPPANWYATVNAWRVEVSGEYHRFTVVAAGNGPPGSAFTYVREGSTSTVTVAGEEVVLGESDTVRFETETYVVVAVPPGPPGVGDVDGERDETSPGWPCPGPVDRECAEG